MKIVVNSGRVVHTLKSAPVKLADGAFSRPGVKANGPTQLLDLPDEEIARLMTLAKCAEWTARRARA